MFRKLKIYAKRLRKRKVKMRMKVFLLTMVLMSLFTRANPKVSGERLEKIFTALVQAVDMTKEFHKTLEENGDITPEKAILSLFKSFPLVGDVIEIFTDDNGALEDKLERFEIQLQHLINSQENILQHLQYLEHAIEMLVLKIQISESSKVIYSCFMDLMHLLRNPTSSAERHRVISCYDNIMREVRHLGRILKEEKFTLESPRLFQYITEADGYCDGKKIVNTYKFVFGIFIMGCEDAILSEKMKYGNTSTTFLNECQTLIRNIKIKMLEIYDKCKDDNCSSVLNVIKNEVTLNINNNPSELFRALIIRFPWYAFTVIKLNGNPTEHISETNLMSHATFNSNGTYIIVLWTHYEIDSNPDDSSLPFHLEFDTKYYESDHRGINLTINLSGKRANVITYFKADVKEGDYKKCSGEISLDSSASANSSNSRKQLKLFTFAIIFVLGFLTGF